MIDEEGAKMFIEVLKVNTTLTKLSVRGNDGASTIPLDSFSIVCALVGDSTITRVCGVFVFLAISKSFQKSLYFFM